MTQDEIIRMAREAGLIQYVQIEKTCVSNALERFAALVAEPWIETNKALAKEIIELKKQSEQKPVLCVECGQPTMHMGNKCYSCCQKATRGLEDALKAAVPVRTKDLTDDEILQCGGMDGADDWAFKFARAVIAADREKNK